MPGAASDRDARSIRGLSTVVGDLFAVTVARGLALAFGVVTVVLTSRLVGPDGYAVIAYVGVFSTLLLFGAAGWTTAAVPRYGREELEATGAMHRTAWARLVITLPLVLLAGLALIALEAAGALPPEYGWSFVRLTLALGALIVVIDHFVVVLEAAGRMRVSAIGLAGRQVLLAAGLVVLALTAGTVSPLTVVSLTVAISVALAVGLAWPAWRVALWPAGTDRASVRRVLLFSAPLIAFTASQYGIRSVDILVLRAYGTAADVGVYALAYQGYTMLQQVATTLTIVLVPLFVSMRQAGRSDHVRRYLLRVVPQATLAAAAVGGLAAAVLFAATPVVFGSGYDGAARPLAVLTVALVLHALASLLAPIMLLYERSGATAVINVVALGVNVAGDFVLIGLLGGGVTAPAVATVGALLIIAAGYRVVAARDVGVARPGSPLLLAPVVVSLAALLLLPEAAGVPLALLGTVAATALLLRFGGLFAAEDVELFAKLDLPVLVRSRLLTVVARLAR